MKEGQCSGIRFFFAILSRCLVNAFIIYQQNMSDDPKLDCRTFIVQVVEGFVGNVRKPGNVGRKRSNVALPPIDLKKHLKRTKLPVGKRKNCAFCSKNVKRVCTSYMCEECGVGLGLGTCWEKYHA